MKRHWLIVVAALLVYAPFLHGQQYTSGSITATASTCTSTACVSIVNQGNAAAWAQISGTFTATISFEGTVDGATWFSIAGVVPTSGVSATSATAEGNWQFQVAGLRSIRLRCSAFTSGTAVVYLRLSAAAFYPAVGVPTVTVSNITTDVAEGGTIGTTPAPVGGAASVGAWPSVVDNGDANIFSTDGYRRQLVTEVPLSAYFAYATTTTANTEVTMLAADASARWNVTDIACSNSSSTVGTSVKVIDGASGSILWYQPCPKASAAGDAGGSVKVFRAPLRCSTTNKALIFQAVDAATTLSLSVSGFKTPN